MENDLENRVIELEKKVQRLQEWDNAVASGYQQIRQNTWGGWGSPRPNPPGVTGECVPHFSGEWPALYSVWKVKKDTEFGRQFREGATLTVTGIGKAGIICDLERQYQVCFKTVEEFRQGCEFVRLDHIYVRDNKFFNIEQPEEKYKKAWNELKEYVKLLLDRADRPSITMKMQHLHAKMSELIPPE